MESHNPFEEFDKDKIVPKERHGCLNIWLLFMIIGNTSSVFTYLLGGENLSTILGVHFSTMTVLLLAFLSAGNVIFAFMLMKWRKMGFVGFGLTTLVTAGINYSFGLSIPHILIGMAGIFILFGLLQLKRNNKSGWQNLE